MTSTQVEDLRQLLNAPESVLVDPASVEKLSKDFYWYSPILKPLLDDKRAEAIVQPRSVEAIRAVLAYCFSAGIPVTVRGSGTGNYGQAIPLQGGVVLDLANLDRVFEIKPEGVAVCEPGAKLGNIENEARKQGWELRCYPSTYVKASLGGFLAGGSGGIGSITYGGLRDNQTVRGIEALTMEAEPRTLHFAGEAVREILHAWGTNGVITKIWLALGARKEWAQMAVAFSGFADCFDFAETIAQDDTIPKRLVTAFEWPIPSYFSPIRRLCPEEEALLFLLVDDPYVDGVKHRAESAGGKVTWFQAFQEPRRGPLLTDYTWNHTTLWALKTDPNLTYLQCAFDPQQVRSQFRRLKEQFGSELWWHVEFVRGEKDAIIPANLPIVRFTTPARLNEMISFCREIGVGVANPHVNELEGGGRYLPNNIQLIAKQKYDPTGLLNPGKMVTFRPGRCLHPTV